MNLKLYFTKKRIIWSVIAIVIIGIIAMQIFGSVGPPKGIIIDAGMA